MLIFTGVRINELLKLTKEMINLNENYFITGSKLKVVKID